MTTRARTFIAAILGCGALLLATAAVEWRSANSTLFVGVLALAMLAATRKIRLPKTTSNISIGFLFILLGIANFSFSEAILLACATAAVQSAWSRRRPTLVQFAFNVSVLGLSTAAGFGGAVVVSRLLGARSLVALLPMAMTVFFLVDTALVSGVIALTESRHVNEVWRQCSLWAFPYYLVGSAVAAVVAASSASIGWLAALMVLPVMYMIYVFYRMYIERTQLQHN